MDRQARKKTLRMFSNGMYVVTSRSGEHYGAATVTWMSQASFQPPLIMTAIRRKSNTFKCLAESRVAAVHVLGSNQQDLAAKFFRPTRMIGGLLNGEPFIEGKTTVPILTNTPAHVECSVRHIFETGGDHAVVILEVADAVCQQQVPPLTIAASPWEYGG
jgi:flavin reductase (DIM6/NTAB) family NADH-FMN oxidoreductase RutF